MTQPSGAPALTGRRPSQKVVGSSPIIRLLT
jgi:hypothetical protein